MGYEAAAKEANEAFSKGIEMKTRKKKGKNYEKQKIEKTGNHRCNDHPALELCNHCVCGFSAL